MTSDFTIAVHTLIYLSHKGSVISSSDLALNICTNAVRIRKITSKLVKADLLKREKGGYKLAKRADEISLSIIGKAIDENFVGVGWKSGKRDAICKVSSTTSLIMDDIYDDLNSIVYKELSRILIKDIEEKIFKEGEK